MHGHEVRVRCDGGFLLECSCGWSLKFLVANPRVLTLSNAANDHYVDSR